MRLSREVPDVDVPSGTEPGTGDPDGYATADPAQPVRLVDPDGGMGVDTEKDMIAEDVGPDLGGYSPEEQAVRVEDETP